MKFSHQASDLYFLNNQERADSFCRTTHLGIGAHQDDLEFMALHGILQCYHQNDFWFSGVTCTDGAGSSRTGIYSDFTDEQMKQIRMQEQRDAAQVGQYSFMAQLGYPSRVAKDASLRAPIVKDLVTILKTTKPEFVYTHNPFDKHGTHIGVLLATLEAISSLPLEQRPKKLYGCEVWRGLDWLPDQYKVLHDISAHGNLANALNGIFDSQIVGGKRYDLAVEGRRLANATFLDSHSTDEMKRVSYAIDLTELIDENRLSVESVVNKVLYTFSKTVHDLISTSSFKTL